MTDMLSAELPRLREAANLLEPALALRRELEKTAPNATQVRNLAIALNDAINRMRPGSEL